MTTKVEVNHIGAIKNLSFDLPEGGGVLVARGTHGTGKSTLVKAVSARLGGDNSGLQPTDGYKKGELIIDHDGSLAKLTLRASGKRNTGSLEVTAIEGRFDLSMMIDPGFKDVKANELARLKALIGLMGNVNVSKTELLNAANVPDKQGVPDEAGRDLLDMVGQIKRFCESRARIAENDLKAKEGHLKAIAEEIAHLDELPAEDATPDELRRLIAASHEQQRQQTVAHELWLKQAEAVKDAREKLEAMPAIDDIANLQFLLNNKNDAYDELQLELADLQSRIEQLRIDRQDLTNRIQHAKQAEFERKRIMAAIRPLEDKPTRIPDQIFTQERGELERRFNIAEQWQKLRDKQHQLDRAKVEFKQLLNYSEAWRQSAQSLWPYLFSKIENVEHLSVFDDELVTQTDRSDREPLRELSAGERALIAIDVAVKAAQPPAFLTISQEIWDGLNEASRKLIRKRCKERCCWILTAAISDGPLEIEEVPE